MVVLAVKFHKKSWVLEERRCGFTEGRESGNPRRTFFQSVDINYINISWENLTP